MKRREMQNAKAAEDCRNPRRFRAFEGQYLSVRFWSAAVLCRFIFAVIALLLPRAFAADLTPAQTQFFENKVRPVLANNCYKCHSQSAEKVKGGLLLDTREALLKGGETGAAIVPGDPEKSLLIKAVRYTDPDLQMPPKGKKLSDDEIADLVAWVKMGAPDPRITTVAQKAWADSNKKHWAWQPLKKPAV